LQIDDSPSGCNYSPPSIYLPRVESRVATVSRVTRCRYHWVRISVGLRLLDMLEIGGVGARDSRSSSDLVNHVDNYAIPRPRYHIRIYNLR
jgi:hypothetical protein